MDDDCGYPYDSGNLNVISWVILPRIDLLVLNWNHSQQRRPEVFQTPVTVNAVLWGVLLV